jgi:hypothetical protein
MLSLDASLDASLDTSLDTSLDASTQIEVSLCATFALAFASSKDAAPRRSLATASTQPRRLDEALVEASMCLNKASSLVYNPLQTLHTF